MRIIIFIFFLLFWPLWGFSQGVDITRDIDSGYFLVVDQDSILTFDGQTYFRGDTLSIDGQQRYNFHYTAFRAGLTFMAQNDLPAGSIRAIEAGSYRLGVDMWYMEDTIIEEVTDTVFVTETDTVFISQDTLFVEVPGDTVFVGQDTIFVEAPTTGYESELLNSVNWQHNQESVGHHELLFEWNSVGNFNDLRWRCIDEIPDTIGFWTVDDAEITFTQAEPEHSYSWQTDCNRFLHVDIWAQVPGWSVRKNEYVNLGMLDSLYRAETGHGVVDGEWNDPTMWEQAWRENSMLWSQDDGLRHENTSSGSQVWIFQGEPAHESIWLKARISPGLHLRLFATEDGHSQDPHFYGGELRYGRWLSGSPGNTSNWDELEAVPVDLEPGPAWIEVEASAEELRIRVWQGGDVPDWQIVTEPVDFQPGRIGIGAHSVSQRLVEELEYIINPQ